MLKKKLGILVASVLTISLFSGCAMFGEDYVAKVGQEKITKSEYNFFLKDTENRLTSLNGGNQIDWTTKIGNVTAKEYAKQTALDNAIDIKIQVMKANAAKFSLTKQEADDLNSQIDTQIKQLGTTGIDQEKALKEQAGVSVSQFKKIYREIYLASKYAQDVEGQYKYTDADLKKYYDEHKKDLDKRTVGHVLYLTQDANGQALSKDKQDAAKKNAEDMAEKLKTGDLAALAKQYSEDTGSKDNGGTYTISQNGQYMPEFENWTFDPARKVGDTGVVQTSYGYHAMKMVKIYTYDEIKDDIKASYLGDKYNSEKETWKKDTANYAVVKNSKVLDPIQVPLK